jgi:hypothetical protein
VPGVDQPLDHRDDLRDVRGGGGLQVRRRHAQRAHVFTVGGGELVGDGGDGNARFARGVVDLVVHVRDVAGVAQAAEAAASRSASTPKTTGPRALPMCT